MFILEKFHKGIEPLFYSGFPHKMTLFWLLELFWRRLCLICIPGPLLGSFLFHLRRILSCLVMMPHGIERLKGVTLKITYNVTTLSNTFYDHETYFTTPIISNTEIPVFVSKFNYFTKKWRSPYYPLTMKLMSRKRPLLWGNSLLKRAILWGVLLSFKKRDSEAIFGGLFLSLFSEGCLRAVSKVVVRRLGVRMR